MRPAAGANPSKPTHRLGRAFTAQSSMGCAALAVSRQVSKASTSSHARLRKATSRRPWVRVICTLPAACRYALICAGAKPAAVRLSERPVRNNVGGSAQSSPGTSKRTKVYRLWQCTAKRQLRPRSAMTCRSQQKRRSLSLP